MPFDLCSRVVQVCVQVWRVLVAGPGYLPEFAGYRVASSASQSAQDNLTAQLHLTRDTVSLQDLCLLNMGMGHRSCRGAGSAFPGAEERLLARLGAAQSR